MSAVLIVHAAGPGITVQDHGRPGYLARGLSRGGAADRTAMAEGAALLARDEGCAALEMAGAGGTFEATGTIRIALTGAPMPARINQTPIAWNASHRLPHGARLSIGGATQGSYGYLHPGGGLAGPAILGGQSVHLAAGLGRPVRAGDRLPLGPDDGTVTGLAITPLPRLDGGLLRLVPGVHTALFDPAVVERFAATTFRRGRQGNRMGVRLCPDGPGFATAAGLRIVSEIVLPGDVQIAGDGDPFVLLGECQTMGGYPRIGTVLPADLPCIAQARPGAVIRFRFVTVEEAVQAERLAETRRPVPRPLRRDPRDMPDLLSCQLISGVTTGDDRPEDDA